MNEKEFNDIKKQILQSVVVKDENIDIYKEILDCCLEWENQDSKLSINLEGSKGSINRYEMKFNIIVAIQLLLVGINGYDSEVNLKNGLVVILGMIAALAYKNTVTLEPTQAQIIYALYQIQERRGRKPSEDDLFNLIHTQFDSNTLSRNEFDEEMEKLRELKCIDITEGKVKLIEKVRF